MTSIIPTPPLTHVSLYKNKLAYYRRQANSEDGLEQDGRRVFRVLFANSSRKLIASTLSASCGVHTPTVFFDVERADKHRHARDVEHHDKLQKQQLHSAQRGMEIESGIIGFLRSCIGQSITVSGSTGTLIMVENVKKQVPPSSENVVMYQLLPRLRVTSLFRSQLSSGTYMSCTC